MRLKITAQPLNGRWSISSATRRDKAEWPPSPDTLFSALVAAAASMGKACHPALYWLEQQGNPVIEAIEYPPTTNGLLAFVPVGDATMWDAKPRKARWHNSIGEASPVTWSWSISTTEHVEALSKIALGVPYLGSSRGPVIMAVHLTEEPLQRSALVPSEQGSYRIRGIYSGRLDDLETAFHREQRPPPSQTTGYVRVGDVECISPWSQLIPLRRERGPSLHLAHTVPVAEAIRRAITAHLPIDGPPALIGHGYDRGALRGEHLAIVPLAHVGNPHADGRLLGAGLMLPRTLGDDDYATLVSALGRWLQGGGYVDMGSVRWHMGLATADHRASLKERRYSGSAQSWATVTPVALDRHPRRSLSVFDVVVRMCSDVGLPAPANVEISQASVITGTEVCRKHYLGGRAYLKDKPLTHMRVSWDREMAGPMLLGRGRYFGLGVLLPDRRLA